MINQRSMTLAGVALLCVVSKLSAESDSTDGADASKHGTSTLAASKLFRQQYHLSDVSFCIAPVCVDFDGDGRRELLFASRKTKQLQMLNAADGKLIWSQKLVGDQQSITAYDLDGDGDFEILYSVSGPGRQCSRCPR